MQPNHWLASYGKVLFVAFMLGFTYVAKQVRAYREGQQRKAEVERILQPIEQREKRRRPPPVEFKIEFVPKKDRSDELDWNTPPVY